MPNEATEGRDTESAQLLPFITQTFPSHDKTLRHLLTSVLLFFTAVAMTIPVRPKLILDAAGDASLASVFTSLIDSFQALISIFSSPLFGVLSDVVGRKPILLFSHGGELIALFLVASFPRNLYVQVPAYLLIALTDAYVSTVSTIIADISMTTGNNDEANGEGVGDGESSAENAVTTTKNFGFLGATFGFCFLIGPALGGIVEEKFYLASSFHVACVLIFAAAMYVSTFVSETKADVRSAAVGWERVVEIADAIRGTEINPLPRVKRIFGGNEALTWFAFAIAMAGFAQGGLNTIVFLYVNVRFGWETKETGIFLSMVGLSFLISQGILAPLAVKYLGERRTILVCYSLSVVHYFLYGVASSAETMYMGLFVGMFSFAAEPAVKGLLSRQVGVDMQGSLQGSLSALRSIVRPLSPVVMGGLFGFGNQIGRPGLPFQFMAVLSAVALVLWTVALGKPGFKK